MKLFSAVLAFSVVAARAAPHLQTKEFPLCDGQPPENYCDCGGDCTAEPDWCSCSEAQECCANATPTVTCDGQPDENYCDCSYDCTANPGWCECEEAQACCAAATSGVNLSRASPSDTN